MAGDDGFSQALTDSGDDDLPRVPVYVEPGMNDVLAAHQTAQIFAVDMTEGAWAVSLGVRDDITWEQAVGAARWARETFARLLDSNDPGGDGWQRSEVHDRWYWTCAEYPDPY